MYNQTLKTPSPSPSASQKSPMGWINYYKQALERQKKTWAKDTAFLDPRITSCICKHTDTNTLGYQKHFILKSNQTKHHQSKTQTNTHWKGSNSNEEKNGMRVSTEST